MNAISEMLQKHSEQLKKIESQLSLSKTVLNIDEVSLLTGLSKSTIYKFTHLGKIPFYKQAKHLFFDKAEIENWLKSNKGVNISELENNAHNSLAIRKGGEL